MGVQIRSVRVYQISGRLVDTVNPLNVTEWEYLLHGPAGQYILQIETDKGTFTKKIIKL